MLSGGTFSVSSTRPRSYRTSCVRTSAPLIPFESCSLAWSHGRAVRRSEGLKDLSRFPLQLRQGSGPSAFLRFSWTTGMRILGDAGYEEDLTASQSPNTYEAPGCQGAQASVDEFPRL